MLATINTDASFSHQHKNGSFSFWVVCDDFKIRKSGLLKTKCDNPTMAECRCIINAVHMLFQQAGSKKVTKIVVNTDSTNAIYLFKNDAKKIAKYGLSWGIGLGNLFRRMVPANVTIDLRHVKAHVTTEGARNYVNDWCDNEAKKALYIGLKEKGITLDTKKFV